MKKITEEYASYFATSKSKKTMFTVKLPDEFKERKLADLKEDIEDFLIGYDIEGGDDGFKSEWFSDENKFRLYTYTPSYIDKHDLDKIADGLRSVIFRKMKIPSMIFTTNLN